MKIVVRAGGNGTRLWPMSRINNPKQFQKIIGDKSMLRTTYERVAPMVNVKKDLFVSVNLAFSEKTLGEIGELDKSNLIIETDVRNTGPAMCLEVCFLERPAKKTDIIASLPSDDYISDNQAFRDLLKTTAQFISENPDYTLTPAIKPDYPDTGYSYLKAGNNLRSHGKEAIFSVESLVEKPNKEYCNDLIKTGTYYCHTGMYLWQLGHISSLFKKFQPAMYDVCQQVVELSLKNDFKKAKKLYSQLEKISIETAITEKVDKIAMSVSNNLGWSDLGKWHVIKRVLSKKQKMNVESANVISENTSNNLIYSNNPKKIIVAYDVNDLVVVDTDDVLFISSLEKSADVKKMVEKLKKDSKEKYL